MNRFLKIFLESALARLAVGFAGGVPHTLRDVSARQRASGVMWWVNSDPGWWSK
jgi:hypothetical protein